MADEVTHDVRCWDSYIVSHKNSLAWITASHQQPPPLPFLSFSLPLPYSYIVCLGCVSRFLRASHFFPFFFFASSPSSETESLTKLDRLVCPLSFLCTSECVSESSVTQWCGFALNLLLWKSPPAPLCSGRCMAAELSAEKWRMRRVVRAHLVLAASDFVGFLFSLPHSSLRPLYSRWEGRPGAVGQSRSPTTWKATGELFRPAVLCPWSLFPGSLSSSTPWPSFPTAFSVLPSLQSIGPPSIGLFTMPH